jgi:hypothetical protein
MFVYPQHFSLDDHLAGVLELTRVTQGEVRVHPIVDGIGATYADLGELRTMLARRGVITQIRSTPGSWIMGGNRTLVCRRS